MKKFITVLLLASAAVFGAAAEAEFYNDFEYDRIPVEAVRDGVGYVAFGDYFDMPFLKARADGDGYVVYGDGYTLEVTPGTSAAVFNGESIELPAAPYVSEHGLCMPARAMFSLAEVYVAYDDISVPAFGSVLKLYSGSGITPVSGTLTDSMYGWSISVPDGFFYMTDSADTDTAYLDNFNGIRFGIKVYSPGASAPKPVSERLEDYLERTEVITTVQGWTVAIEGEIYSNPSGETRALLNTIIDSFTAGYTAGARDVSNISDDGTRLEVASIRKGMAFDVPVGWDVRGGGIGYDLFDGGETLEVDTEICNAGDGVSRDSLKEAYEYYRPAKLTAEEDIEFNGYKVNICSYDIAYEDGGSYVSRASIEHEGNIYCITVTCADPRAEGEAAASLLRDKAEIGIGVILDTLRLSDPGSETDEPELVSGAEEAAEVTVGGLAFTVPGRLPYKEYYDGSDGAETVRVLGPLDGSYLTISHSPDIDNILSDDIFTLGLYAMYEKAEPVEINGIRFERWTNRGDSDDNIYISRQDGLMIGCCIKDEEKGSPYASDIMSVLESIHHTA